MILRIATLLVCLMLAACAGGKTPGSSDTTSSISSFLPSSFSTPTLDPPEGSSADDRTIKARAQCWAKVEHEKNLRGIDQRVGYVDRCVASQLQQ
jgi:ABC-type glycerol-3-phosphate transport system substrate-binding protein